MPKKQLNVLIMKGLPCTGKTTYAKENYTFSEKGDWIHVCRDDIREILFGPNYPFSFKNEKIVKKVEEAAIINSLNAGKHVVIDSTHLSKKHISRWDQFLREWQNGNNEYELNKEVKVMAEVSSMDRLHRIVARNRDRNNGPTKKFVPTHVVYNMALQYNMLNYHRNNQPVIVCDIDGTLAEVTHRLPFLYNNYKEGSKMKADRDWDAFFSHCYADPLIESTKEKLLAATEEYNVPREQVIFVTARPEKTRVMTEDWLDRHLPEFPANFIIMRPDNDRRPDTNVKEEIYHRFLKNKNVIKIFDDRPAVIQMWHKYNLNVVDVGDGIEF